MKQVIIENDFKSRKPIHISFKVSLLDSQGNELHSIAFKEKNYHYGLYIARQQKRKLESPVTQLGIVAARVSDSMGFEFDTVKGPDHLMEQIFENASVEWLEEYLQRTKHERDIQFIQNELKKRGELS